MPLPFERAHRLIEATDPPDESLKPMVRPSPRRAAGLTLTVAMALANAAAGGGLVWFVMKDEPAKLAAETDFALGKLKAAVIGAGCAATDTLGTWYLKTPVLTEPMPAPPKAIKIGGRP